jgi:GxxExxY protein
MINTDNYKYSDITEKIIKAFYIVYNNLGYGFLEKVYQNALFIELTKMGLFVEKQKQVNVYYDGLEVGLYFADLVIESIVIVELKAAEALCRSTNFS